MPWHRLSWPALACSAVPQFCVFPFEVDGEKTLNSENMPRQWCVGIRDGARPPIKFSRTQAKTRQSLQSWTAKISCGSLSKIE